MNFDTHRQPLLYIFISAAFFGVSPPLAKLLAADIPPVVLAGLLYLGSFLGLWAFSLVGKLLKRGPSEERASLERRDLPWLAGAVLSGGVAAPISLMFGLTLTSGFAASLLLNLEGVATALIAVLLFKENAGKRLWWALASMTLAGVCLAWNPGEGQFNLAGPLLILLAMVCWGVDNNLTRHISARDPIQIALFKGLIAGTVSLFLAYLTGATIPLNGSVLFALLLGAFSYGVSLVFFIRALEGLGSFRTGLFFSLAPFVGAVTSLVLLREWIGWVMFPATGLMIAGFRLMIEERHDHRHRHEAMTHIHAHDHQEIHHQHPHGDAAPGNHVHEHRHPAEVHDHAHWPDTHHRHDHDH